MPLWLLGRLQFSFQALQIADNHAAAIDLDHSLRLQPGEIAGYELAHCANLRRQFLVANWHGDFHTLRSTLAFLLGETQQKRSEPVTYRGE
jgi:hypothetical protein